VTRVGVVVNEAAAGGRAGRVWDRLAGLAGSLAATRVARPADRQDAVVALRRLLDAGVERVIVVGGDGTVHLAVNQLMAAGAEVTVALGLVPAGTGSDLARALALPRRPEDALRRALLGPVRRLDVGLVAGEGGRFHFANVASAGIGGLVDDLVNSDPRKGRISFLVATVKALRRYRPIDLRVVVDGQPWHAGEAFLVAVANGTSFGKGMRVAPHARMDDGLFDVVLVEPLPAARLLTRLPRVYLGRHLHLRQVKVTRGRRIELVPHGPTPPMDADGETYRTGAVELTVLPAALGFASAEGAVDA